MVEDDDHQPMNPLGNDDDEDTVLEHPDYLDLNGVNPDHLPPFPDNRLGWEVPYTEEEAVNTYDAPEEFAQKCK